MSWSSFVTVGGRVLNYKLVTLGTTAVTPRVVLTVIVVLVLTVLLSRLLRRGMQRAFRRWGHQAESSVASINRLVHYAVMLLGTGIALQTAGFNLNALFAAGAVFAVGIGFAMQNIVQNFVSGVILLVEHVIKPGDILDVGGQVVKVINMGIRSTVVLTRDGENVIVPNSLLVQSSVKNFTLKDSHYRLRAQVGVIYGSDMALVRKTLERVALEVEWRHQGHEPIVLMTGFGDNSVNFEASVWIDTPWEARVVLGRLYEALWWALKREEIVIAFPQLDVHFDPKVEQGFGGLVAVRS